MVYNGYSVYDLWCVLMETTLFISMHNTYYGMCTTHCVIWHLVETVELIETYPIKFQIEQ